LETVIPKIDKLVKILKKGRYRGLQAKLTAINKEAYNVEVEIMDEGLYQGKVLQLEYEEVSKLLT